MPNRFEISPVSFFCVFIIAFATSSMAQSPCSVPDSLQKAIVTKYGHARILQSSDLSTEDREMFAKDHGVRCPGLTPVDFYGNGKPTWAVILLISSPKPRAELILAHESGNGFEIKSLDNANQEAAVVWSQAPGNYKDIETGKTIHAIHPVIVFVGYDSWAIAYAWIDNRIQKVWLQD